MMASLRTPKGARRASLRAPLSLAHASEGYHESRKQLFGKLSGLYCHPSAICPPPMRIGAVDSASSFLASLVDNSLTNFASDASWSLRCRSWLMRYGTVGVGGRRSQSAERSRRAGKEGDALVKSLRPDFHERNCA